MYYWRKEEDKIIVECNKCGKVLKFDKKYFNNIVNDDYCETNTVIQCLCGNTANGIIKKKRSNEKSDYDKSNLQLPRCPHCGGVNIQLVKRRWSFWTGFLTNKVDRYCVNCKKKF